MVDKDRISGKGKEVKGTVKEAVGKLIGDESMELRGKGEKIAGKVQQEYGKLKDELRSARKDACAPPKSTRR